MRCNIILVLASASWLFAAPLVAAPWVNTDDHYLRNSIQLLADAGHIRSPVNTFPLMWRPLLQDIAKIDANTLNDSELLAYTRLLTAARFAQQTNITSLALSASTDPLGQSVGGTQYQQQGMVSLGSEVKGNNWSAGVFKQFRDKPYDSNLYTDNKSHWDGSYGAYAIGNWAVLAGVLPQWWGPAQQQSFLFDNKSRPAKSLQLSRLNANELLGSTFDWLGPVHLNVQVGEYAGTAVLRHARYGAARANFRPVAAVEFGASIYRLRPYADQLLAVPELFERYVVADSTTLGIDFQWRRGAWSLYSEISSQRSVAIANGWLLGAQWHFGHQSLLLHAFAEWQHIPEDYQYWQSLQPNEAITQPKQLVTFGVKAYMPQGHAAYAKLSVAADSHTVITLVEDIPYLNDPITLSAGIQLPVLSGLLSFDYQLQHGDNSLNQQSEFAHTAGVKWEWRW